MYPLVEVKTGSDRPSGINKSRNRLQLDMFWSVQRKISISISDSKAAGAG